MSAPRFWRFMHSSGDTILVNLDRVAWIEWSDMYKNSVLYFSTEEYLVVRETLAYCEQLLVTKTGEQPGGSRT